MGWEVGKHGIEIDFKDSKGKSYGGTFLPEVALEQKWNQKETLQYLIRKAGYRGQLEEVIGGMEVQTYESLKFKISYDDYLKEKA